MQTAIALTIKIAKPIIASATVAYHQSTWPAKLWTMHSWAALGYAYEQQMTRKARKSKLITLASMLKSIMNLYEICSPI